jgi:hypothetical protein
MSRHSAIASRNSITITRTTIMTTMRQRREFNKTKYVQNNHNEIKYIMQSNPILIGNAVLDLLLLLQAYPLPLILFLLIFLSMGFRKCSVS